MTANWKSLMPKRRVLRGKSIAFVGADGAGKSTVIGSLLDNWPEICRYIYMGASIERANYSLPTSRWTTRRKLRALGSTLDDPNVLPPTAIMTPEQRERLGGNHIVKALGLVNRVLEQWFRQLIVTTFKLQGFAVLCDRHFLFDYCPNLERSNLPLSVRIHHWLLAHAYPRPDMVIFLDADPAILLQRKPEWPIEHLERQRSDILDQAKYLRNFVRVDVSRNLEAVLSDVADKVRRMQSK